MVRLISFLVLLSCGNVYADTKWTATPDSKVTFLAVGNPSFMKIAGTGAHPVGSLTISGDNAAGSFTVKLNDFTTKNNMRDGHMRDKYLETSKPGNDTATLVVKTLPAACMQSATKCDFSGDLTLHGATKPVKGSVTSDKSGAGAHALVEYKIKLTDFAIVIPSFAGITVADEVTIDSDITLQ